MMKYSHEPREFAFGPLRGHTPAGWSTGRDAEGSLYWDSGAGLSVSISADRLTIPEPERQSEWVFGYLRGFAASLKRGARVASLDPARAVAIIDESEPTPTGRLRHRTWYLFVRTGHSTAWAVTATASQQILEGEFDFDVELLTAAEYSVLGVRHDSSN